MTQQPPPQQPYVQQYPQPYATHPQQYAPYDPTTPPPPRGPIIWDRVLTIVLLGIGLFGAGYGVLTGITYEEAVTLAMQWQDTEGIWSPPPWLGAAGAFMAISHVLLYLAAVAISVPLMIRNRIAFWAPLGAGVLAALIYHGTSFVAGLLGAVGPALGG